ncbi:hypothetical protein PGIGA_G00076680 [Pangasianodon gigas]|uniref:Uncharacterized protein n=1 Tax=Pangasianodon gigas TaxID=30993 RepID=A0ACC5X939_PANGG|nr:hypothetical protein [Pangasianodon gigas]
MFSYGADRHLGTNRAPVLVILFLEISRLCVNVCFGLRTGVPNHFNNMDWTVAYNI